MNKFKIILLTFIVGLLGLTSCNEYSDAWNAHYNEQLGEKSDLNLYQMIKSKDQLSKFAQMLEISGYDSILSKPQTYTVWAPDNAALANVDLSDTLSVKNIVMNHISRFSIPTSGLQSRTIFLLDKKFVNFKRDVNGFTFGNIPLVDGLYNLAAANGIVHGIAGYVPYMTNLWEFIGYAEGLDSLRTFLNSQSSYEFDAKASVEIGTNEFGQAIYDSVINFSNPILDKIGHMYVEDSVYSALLPNNNAWTDAYYKVMNNYKTLLADGGAPKQRYYSQIALIENLVFRKLITDPTSNDSLISTTGNLFKTPGYLFDNTVKHTLSNGIAYITDSLRFKAEESWQRPIILEAENSSFGRSYAFANLYVRSSLGSEFEGTISGSKYLLVQPTSVSNTSMSAVSFPVPNTLSGKYNIYCVLTPSNIIPANKALPNKVKFYISYMKADGTTVSDAPIDSKNLILAPNKIAGTFTSNTDTISKMFVTQYEFPYCNILEEGDPSTKITFKLKVENAVKITESVRFSREMRIDYIILEPAL